MSESLSPVWVEGIKDRANICVQEGCALAKMGSSCLKFRVPLGQVSLHKLMLFHCDKGISWARCLPWTCVSNYSLLNMPPLGTFKHAPIRSPDRPPIPNLPCLQWDSEKPTLKDLLNTEGLPGGTGEGVEEQDKEGKKPSKGVISDQAPGEELHPDPTGEQMLDVSYPWEFRGGGTQLPHSSPSWLLAKGWESELLGTYLQGKRDPSN